MSDKKNNTITVAKEINDLYLYVHAKHIYVKIHAQAPQVAYIIQCIHIYIYIYIYIYICVCVCVCVCVILMFKGFNI